MSSMGRLVVVKQSLWSLKMEKITSCKKSWSSDSRNPQLWKAVHTKIREGNEQAKMGNGWRVLGSGQVHTQNPWRRRTGSARRTTSIGRFKRYKTIKTQADWLLSAFYVRSFHPFLFCFLPWLVSPTCSRSSFHSRLV
jgi:hypothetical protein